MFDFIDELRYKILDFFDMVFFSLTHIPELCRRKKAKAAVGFTPKEIKPIENTNVMKPSLFDQAAEMKYKILDFFDAVTYKLFVRFKKRLGDKADFQQQTVKCKREKPCTSPIAAFSFDENTNAAVENDVLAEDLEIVKKKGTFTKALLVTTIVILILMLGGFTSYAVTTTFPDVFMPKLMASRTKTIEVEVPVEVIKVKKEIVEVPVVIPAEPEIITNTVTLDGGTETIYETVEVPVETDGQGGAGLPTEPAPPITQQPTDQTSYDGAPVTFTVAAQGENVNYQWYTCSAPGYEQAKLIVGADTSTYTLDTLSLFNEMNGSYYFCEVWADDSVRGRSDTAQLKMGVTVTVNSTAGGNVAVSNLTPLIGEDITVSGAADSGYKLKSFSYSFGYGDVTITGTDTSFTVPPMATGVVINAEFSTAYPITLTVNGQGTTSLSSDTGCANDLIIIQAIPNLGYSTSAIRYHNGVEWVNLDTYSGVSFAMPAAATSVEVTYSKLPYNLSTSVEKGKGSISLATNIGYIGDVVAVNVTPTVPYTLGKLIYTYYDGSTWIEEDITDSKAFTCQPYTGTVKAYFEPQNPYYQWNSEQGIQTSHSSVEFHGGWGWEQSIVNNRLKWFYSSAPYVALERGGEFAYIDVTDYDYVDISYAYWWAHDDGTALTFNLRLIDSYNTVIRQANVGGWTGKSGTHRFDISDVKGAIKVRVSTVGWGYGDQYIDKIEFGINEPATMMAFQAAPQLPQTEQTTPVLTYDLNGGATENAQTYTAQELAADTVVTLPDGADLSREGYIFKGWSVVAESIDVLDSYTMPNADVTLYAVWEEAPEQEDESSSAPIERKIPPVTSEVLPPLGSTVS